jgi:hypothetical protein
MKKLTQQLRLTSLLTLILLAATAAYSQITPLGDTYTNSADPTTNYGAGTTLNVDAAKEIAYIQFNLASIPTGASVSQATLKLYVNGVTTAGAFELYAVNGAWTESGLTYDLAPALGSVIDSNVAITTADKNQYILIPVTATVQDWLATPSSNFGVALVAVGSFNATFDSKESTTTSHAPELDIVFAGDGTLTGVTTASGSGLTGGGTSGTLNLALTNACTSGQVLEWNGSTWACTTPKAGGTITGVTAGTDLTGGGTSGKVTLNLNTTALNSTYAQLGAANTFTGNQTLNGTITATSAGETISATSTSTTAQGAVIGNGVGGGVYGSASTSDFGVGVFGAGTAASGTSFGVAGSSSSTSGIGVSGYDTASSGTTYGVAGSSFSPVGYGTFGQNLATTGSAIGVWGTSASSAGYGVEGSVSSPNAIGIFGSNSATTGNAVGVYGTSSSSGGFGVQGSVSSPTGYGVYGGNLVASGTTAGVFGGTASPTGYGVEGDNFATTGNAPGLYGTSASTTGYGVYGAGVYGVYGSDTSSDGENYGVFGTSPQGDGVYGTSVQGDGVFGNGLYGVYGNGVAIGVSGNGEEVGVTGVGGLLGIDGTAGGQSITGSLPPLDAGAWGDTGGTSGEFAGVLATADSNNALFAANNDPSGDYPTMVAENFTTATHNPVFQTSSPNTYSGSRHCTIDTSANLTCTGVVSGIVQQVDGKQTAIYAMQSAENWLEDAGSGELSNGSARIELDSAFAQTVNAGVEYHVFLTPNGDSKGLYVSHKTATSFEVHEQGGGTSSIAFDYRIMAKRKGYENVRLEDLTERFRQPVRPARKARPKLPPLPSAKPKSVPTMPTPPMHPLVAPRPVPEAPKSLPVPAVRAAQAGKPEINQK